ncbi:MAG: HNH endonuclease [Cryomorphaceae bacterium]|nr:HNH endonuclease [Cryomorphaceae bacterium]
MKNKDWTREETIIAFNVYCKIPFKSSSKSNPTIIKYSNLIGRSPSALNMKIGNIGRLDPVLKEKGIVGLSHGSKLEEQIWEEFNGDWERLAFESELLISKYANKSIEELLEIEIDKLGVDRETIVKQRVNQNFFRSTVLSSYYFKCCITGLSVTDLLIASHIVPWSVSSEQRLNPRNGLCLNSLHDRAFDQGYISITPDFKIIVSKSLWEFEDVKSVQDFFLKFHGQQIQLPDRFIPDREFLDYHHSNIFKK